MSALNTRVYRTERLQAQAPYILKEVRDGHPVILSDDQGFDMVLCRQEHYDALEYIAVVAAHLGTIEQARRAGRPLTQADMGSWTWLRFVDAENLDLFCQEVADALVLAAQEQRSGALRMTLHEWEVTAVEVMAHPHIVEQLTGPLNPDDFIDLPRP